MDLVYRSLERRDLQQIFELGREHFGSPSQFSWDWSMSKLEEYLDIGFGTGVVCVNQGLAGFALAQNRYSEQKPDVAWLTYVMVDPRHEGKGIGRELCDRLTTALKGIGITEIVTDVYEDNRDSLEFFKKGGFDVRERWFILSRKV